MNRRDWVWLVLAVVGAVLVVLGMIGLVAGLGEGS